MGWVQSQASRDRKAAPPPPFARATNRPGPGATHPASRSRDSAQQHPTAARQAGCGPRGCAPKRGPDPDAATGAQPRARTAGSSARRWWSTGRPGQALAPAAAALGCSVWGIGVSQGPQGGDARQHALDPLHPGRPGAAILAGPLHGGAVTPRQRGACAGASLCFRRRGRRGETWRPCCAALRAAAMTDVELPEVRTLWAATPDWGALSLVTTASPTLGFLSVRRLLACAPRHTAVHRRRQCLPERQGHRHSDSAAAGHVLAAADARGALGQSTVVLPREWGLDATPNHWHGVPHSPASCNSG